MLTAAASSVLDSARRPIGLALLLVVTLPAQADVIRLKRGNPIVAHVWEEGEAEVAFNIFRTGIRRVVHGTDKVPAANVRAVQRDADPHRTFWRRAATIEGGTADDWVKLGQEAKADKLRDLAEFAFVEALVRDANHEAAAKELGSSRLKEVKARDPRLNTDLREKLQGYLTLEDAESRKAAAKEITNLGATWPDHYLERAFRSSKQTRGLTEDRLLTLDSDKHAGAVYTLFVPKNYDPFQPTPLVLGLHGGGAGGKDRTGVVGSGTSAMNFFRSKAEELGWLVACPTALRAPWANPDNDAFVLAVVDEVGMLFNVDVNRIYLAGHSMGGYGTWHFGPKHAHLWAAISPNAGGGRPDLKQLDDTQTGVYCYHGADDAVVGPDSDRELANQMIKRGMDFVYCEIPDSGHGWPSDVRDEMWDFFKVRRLAATPTRSPRGRYRTTETALSSFLAKPTKREIATFGAFFPPSGESTDASQVRALITDLVSGGGRAEKAAERLASIEDAKVAADVAKVLANSNNNQDARRFAATALGAMGQRGVLKVLRRAALDEALPVVSAAAHSIGRLQDPEAPKCYEAAIAALARRFDGKKTGDRMDFTDFEAHLDCASHIAQGIAATANPACARALDAILKTFLLAPVDVPTSQRAGQDAARPRRALAKAIVEACAALDTSDTRPTLEVLAGDATYGVSDRAQELLAAQTSR